LTGLSAPTAGRYERKPAQAGAVTVIAKHLEMGQGSYTGLATVLAEELDVDWRQIRVESAPADAKLYNNLDFGTIQGTAAAPRSRIPGRSCVRRCGSACHAGRRRGDRMNVPAAEISVDRAVVHHAASRRQAGFGALAGIGFLWRKSLIDRH
jgi:isoquinoline 1-oxidoreductase beta subunit